MEASITAKNSEKDVIIQKAAYKYFIRHGIEFDERNLRKQALRNRSIITWNLSSERNAKSDIKMQEKMFGIQSTKIVQKLNLIISNSTEFSRLEKVIKQKKSSKEGFFGIFKKSRRC